MSSLRSLLVVGVIGIGALAMTGCRGNPLLAALTKPSWDDQLHAEFERKYSDLPAYIKTHYEPLTDPIKRKEERNRICSELVWLVDYSYAQDVHNLHLGDDSLNFFGDLTTLGLTTAATISGGVEAKTALAGLATLILGSKTAMDADFMHRQTVTALITEMDAVRQHKHVVLLRGLSRSDEDYPLYQALGDVYAYKLGGSPLGAIVELGNMTTEASIRSKKDYEDMIAGGGPQPIESPTPTLAGRRQPPATNPSMPQ